MKSLYKKISSAKEITVVFKPSRKSSSVSSLPFSKKVKITLNTNPEELIRETNISQTILSLAYGYTGNISNLAGLVVALAIFIATILSNIASISHIEGYLMALITGSLVSQGITALKHAKRAYSEETVKLHMELYSLNMEYKQMVSTITHILKHSAEALINKKHSGTLLFQRKVFRYMVNVKENTVKYVQI